MAEGGDAKHAGAAVRRTYRYRLYPTRRQREAFEAQLRFACELWNAALEQRRDAYRRCGESLGYCAQSAELTELRREAPELLPPDGMNTWSQQEVLRRLDRAFAAFFARLRRAESPGYPRFKAPRRFSTLAWSLAGNAGGVAITDEGRLRLQGIGCVKVKWHRPIPRGAVPGQLRITRKGTGPRARYYASVSLELPEPARRQPMGEAVGIDVGVRALVALSTDERVEGPHAGSQNAARIRRAARRVARRKRGSHRRAKAAQVLARQREREANRRRDAAHKLSRALADRFCLIAVEDLQIRNMLRSARGTVEEPGSGVAAKRSLNREIADRGWGMLFSLLAYKAEEAGARVVKVPPRGTSRTCSRCGAEERRSRRGALFRCLRCGYEGDADVNAARVILRRALELLGAEELQTLGIRPGRGRQAPTEALASVA